MSAYRRLTVYENLRDMLRLAEELRDTFKAQGNEHRAALYARRVEEHKAALSKFAPIRGSQS